MRTRHIALATAIWIGLGTGATAGDDRGPNEAAPQEGAALDLLRQARSAHRPNALERTTWSRSGAWSEPVLAADGRLRVLAADGLHCVDPGTGKSVWTLEADVGADAAAGCVVGPDGTSYFGVGGAVRAVDGSGKALWRTPVRAGRFHRAPVLAPNGTTVFATAEGVRLASLRASDGSLNWLRRDRPSPHVRLTFDHRDRLLSTDDRRIALHTLDGQALWERNSALDEVLVVGDRLIGLDHRAGRVECWNLRNRNTLWAVQTPARAAGPSVGLAAHGSGRVTVAHATGRVTQLDPDGSVRWTVDPGAKGLHRPVATRGGDTLVADTSGRLLLLGGDGALVSARPLGDGVPRGRPIVLPDGGVIVATSTDLVRMDGKERPVPPKLVASTLTVVADDFVVDVWINGKKVPTSSRKLLEEVFGATTERLRTDLREGDWIVFHVVANRLRWGGSSYFGALALDPGGRLAFASTLDGNWSYCDDVDHVKRFIAERGFGADQLVDPPAVPWGDGPKQWRKHTGHDLPGDAVWGKAPSTWIKCVVPPAGSYEIPTQTVDGERRIRRPRHGPKTGGAYRGPGGLPPDSREPADPPPPPPDDHRPGVPPGK